MCGAEPSITQLCWLARLGRREEVEGSGTLVTSLVVAVVAVEKVGQRVQSAGSIQQWIMV